MWISFAWTTPQFLSGKKTVTRRRWKDRTLRMWQKAWDKGRLEHDAYDTLPIRGGQKIGRFKMTKRPYREALKDMPCSDLKEEGFGDTLQSTREYIEFIKADPEDVLVVIRFEKLKEGDRQ